METRPTSGTETRERSLVERQLSYNIAGLTRSKREGNIFDAFYIIGLSPEGLNKNQSQIYPPSILYQYPEDIKESFPLVPNFCFPHGIETKVIKRTKSLSTENGILYSTMSTIQEKNHSFVVLLTGEQHLYYGICVADVEFVKIMPSFIDPSAQGFTVLNKPHKKPHTTLDSLIDHMGNLFGESSSSFGGLVKNKARSHTRFENRTTLVAPRCYLLISKFPFFQLHFGILYKILENEHLFRVTKEPSNLGSFQILESYQNTHVPKEVEIIQVALPGELEPLSFSCPSGSEDQLLVDFFMTCMFGLLHPEVIVTLLSTLLQEEPVIFVSKNLSVLSAIILSLIPLLRPFTWQGLFIPILPQSLHECMDAPVPYVIGVENLPSNKNKPTTIVFDIDSNQFLGGIPNIAPMPKMDELIAKIIILSQTFPFAEAERIKCLNNPYSSTPQQRDTVKKLTHYIIQWNTENFHDNIKLAIINSPVPKGEFDFALEKHLDTVVQQFPPKFHNFYKKLLSSQMYSFHFDRKLNDKKLFK